MCSDEQLSSALLLAIQHPAICSEQQAVATLLCTSKQLATAVKERCSCLVPVKYRFSSLQQAIALAKWLGVHGSLAQSLDVGPYEPGRQIGARRDDATAAIADALFRASNSQQGLKLQRVVLNEVSNNPALLEQVAHSSQLTGLTVLLPRYNKSVVGVAPRQLAGVVPPKVLSTALAGLTSLRNLVIHSRWHHQEANTDTLIPPLRSLTSLMSLSINEPRDFTKLAHLPVQLQHLTLILAQAEYLRGVPQREPLQLAHLTALTKISYCRSSSIAEVYGDSYGRPYNKHKSGFAQLDPMLAGSLRLQPEDQLPPALADVTVHSVSSGAAQNLQQLRRLSLFGGGFIKAPVLQELAQQCQQLTSLELTYLDAQAHELESVAATWHALPLTALRLNQSRISNAVLQRLVASSKSLTLLKLECRMSSQNVGVLAAVLQQLKGLRALQIKSVSVRDIIDSDDDFLASDEFDDDELDYELHGQYVSYSESGSVNDTDRVTQSDQLLLSAVATLPQLHCFAYSIERVQTGCSQQVFTALGAATQLTALQLQQCGLEDRTVANLVTKLTGLRELDVSKNAFVTCRILPPVAKQLSQLTYLNICETFINEFDVGQMPRLKILRMGSSRPTETARAWRGAVMDLDE